MSDNRAKITFYLPSEPVELEGDLNAVHALAEFLRRVPTALTKIGIKEGVGLSWDPMLTIVREGQILTFPVKTPFKADFPNDATSSREEIDKIRQKYTSAFNQEQMCFIVELDEDLFFRPDSSDD